MLDLLRRKRDFFAGGLLILLGLGTVYEVRDLDFGTLESIGPGVVPQALGIILALLGVVIAGSAAVSLGEEESSVIPQRAEWRGWICVVAGPVLFIIFGHYGGLIPATFTCVFVAALGDRTGTWKGAVVLATGITITGYLLFSYALGVQLPPWSWTFP